MKLKDYIDKRILGLYVNAIKKGKTSVTGWSVVVFTHGVAKLNDEIETTHLTETEARDLARYLNLPRPELDLPSSNVAVPYQFQHSHCALSLLMEITWNEPGHLPTTDEFWNEFVPTLIDAYERTKDWKQVLALCF